MGNGLKRPITPGLSGRNNNKLNSYRAELHIHTVLSPCAAVEMIPPLIIHTAQDRGINLIAITDHNSIANVPAVINAALGTSIHVLSGIELQTKEEIHSICLFDDFNQLEAFYKSIENSFPKLPNNPDFFGEQFIVDAEGNFVRREERLLSISANITLRNACELAQKYKGILIPAHVNRKLFGMLSVLGFVPSDVDLPILEISKHKSQEEIIKEFPQLKKFGLIQSGDAHQLDEILGLNQFNINEPTISEIKKAISNKDQRSYMNLRYHIKN